MFSSLWGTQELRPLLYATNFVNYLPIFVHFFQLFTAFFNRNFNRLSIWRIPSPIIPLGIAKLMCFFEIINPKDSAAEQQAVTREVGESFI
jgi:hypothetical protein